jgi:hypothetical protein
MGIWYCDMHSCHNHANWCDRKHFHLTESPSNRFHLLSQLMLRHLYRVKHAHPEVLAPIEYCFWAQLMKRVVQFMQCNLILLSHVSSGKPYIDHDRAGPLPVKWTAGLAVSSGSNSLDTSNMQVEFNRSSAGSLQATASYCTHEPSLGSLQEGWKENAGICM